VTVQPLRLLGDPVLRTECDPVTRFDDATGRLVDDLMDTVLLPGRAGLAAPQIGVSLAAFSYNVDGQHGYILNPVVVETSGEYEGPEGCLSIPGLTADTLRAMHTVVTGVNRHGDRLTVAGSGELSRVLQHETDHLRGVLFIDRLTGQRRKDALAQIRRAAHHRTRRMSLPVVRRPARSSCARAAWSSGYLPPMRTVSVPSRIQRNRSSARCRSSSGVAM
jgi:peptide deformylase